MADKHTNKDKNKNGSNAPYNVDPLVMRKESMIKALATEKGIPLEQKEALIKQITLAKTDEELNKLLDEEAAKANVGGPNAHDPDITPEKAKAAQEAKANAAGGFDVDQLMGAFNNLFGDFFKPTQRQKAKKASDIPNGAPSQHEPVEGLASPSLPDSLRRLINPEAVRRTEVFTRMCEDKELNGEPNLLDRYNFLERHAPSVALDYDLAKGFVASKQALDIGSAIGLVRAEQTITTARNQRLAKQMIGAALAGALGVYIGRELVKAFKK